MIWGYHYFWKHPNVPYIWHPIPAVLHAQGGVRLVNSKGVTSFGTPWHGPGKGVPRRPYALNGSFVAEEKTRI